MTALSARGTRAMEPTPRRGATLGIAGGLLAMHILFCSLMWTNSPAAGPVPADRLILRLDPNQATADELRLLPRIGEKLASTIITYRKSATSRPAFRRPEDLDCVPRIGPATVELLRPHLLFPDSDEPSPQQEHQ